MARMYQQTPVRGDVLKRAEKEAAYVARKGGFAIDWVDCADQRDACSRELQQKEMVSWFGRTLLPENTLKAGSALIGSPHTSVYTSIYYEQVRRIARTDEVSEGTLLGYVMVHELGHLMGLSMAAQV